MIYGISNAKASMLVQNVHSFIIDECTGACLRISDSLKEHAGKIDKKLLRKNMHAFVNENIINEYKKILQTLPAKVCEMLEAYSGKEEYRTALPLFGEEVFHYQISYELINEYGRTDKIATAVEEIVEKSLDFVLPRSIGSGAVCEAMQFAKPGSALLESIGMGSASHAGRQNEEILNMLTGVNKNFAFRIQSIMLKHFTNVVYESCTANDNDSEMRLIS